MNLAPQQKRRARRLRQQMTPTETRLWRLLRSRRFAGVKFRRQQPLGPFIADFFCDQARLVVELDGQSHVAKAAYDEQRDRWLKEHGYQVVRVWDSDVYANCEGVLRAIDNALALTRHSASLRVRPLPEGEGREADRRVKKECLRREL
jgi:very-short-patch-repair endonuclease